LFRAKKRIKIFAAFDKDVEEDVVRFGDFLCGSLEQPKEQIEAGLETCEYFLLILGGETDEFALDKLNRAIERYAETHGNPDVHIFVNAANKDAKKKLDRKRVERENLREELREAEGEERNDLWDDISAVAKEIDELQDKTAAMEKDTLALYQNYAKMTIASGYNARLKRALECIERGELDRARRVLDPDGSISNLKALVNENEILAARIETNKKLYACGVVVTETEKFIQISSTNILRKAG